MFIIAQMYELLDMSENFCSTYSDLYLYDEEFERTKPDVRTAYGI